MLVTLARVAFVLSDGLQRKLPRAILAEGDPSYYLKRQALYALVGLGALVILARVNFRSLRHAGGPMLLVSFFFLLAVLAIGTAVNGARRWLPLGIIDFQPSELAKLALAFWVQRFSRVVALALLGRCRPIAWASARLRPHSSSRSRNRDRGRDHVDAMRCRGARSLIAAAGTIGAF